MGIPREIIDREVDNPGTLSDAITDFNAKIAVITGILIRAGLTTPEEFDRAVVQTSAEIDRACAEVRERTIARIVQQARDRSQATFDPNSLENGHDLG